MRHRGEKPRRVLAIDPGRDKCGVIVVDERDGVLARGVVPLDLAAPIARDWSLAHRPDRLLIGGGTGSRALRDLLQELNLPVSVVPEAHTTRRARERYCKENPPGGIFRLKFLQGLFTPPVPVDDYAALIIAEDYLLAHD